MENLILEIPFNQRVIRICFGNFSRKSCCKEMIPFALSSLQHLRVSNHSKVLIHILNMLR